MGEMPFRRWESRVWRAGNSLRLEAVKENFLKEEELFWAPSVGRTGEGRIGNTLEHSLFLPAQLQNLTAL
jgi:hypothetical protein